ncbi:T cell receptor gamma chain [Sigmodon hispidus]
MKFSWLTVTEKSMRKEHSCVVKHENNRKGGDQEIPFPPIKKVAVSTGPTACWHEDNVLQLKFTSTSAYYTYLLLLLKSVVHLVMVSFSLFRRASVCGNKKQS